MIWGAFSYHGVSDLIFLPKNETMNKEKYLELLSDNLYDSFIKCRVNVNNGIFQQDGASCHTANIVKSWFEFVNIEYIQDWPGNSPDLNPIENLWAIMKEELRGRDTSSLPKLEKEIQDVWANIDTIWEKVEDADSGAALARLSMKAAVMEYLHLQFELQIQQR